jgi:hypothetical protein
MEEGYRNAITPDFMGNRLGEMRRNCFGRGVRSTLKPQLSDRTFAGVLPHEKSAIGS